MDSLDAINIKSSNTDSERYVLSDTVTMHALSITSISPPTTFSPNPRFTCGVSMASFPQEIFYDIIESLNTASHIDWQTLEACALVCRTWRPIAQRLIHHTFKYNSEKHSQSCLGATTKLRFQNLVPFPNLLAHISTFTVIGTCFGRVVDPAVLSEIIKLLTHVRRVELGSLTFSDLGDSRILFAGLLSVSTLTSVHITDSVLSTADAQILFAKASPSMRELRLTRTMLHGGSMMESASAAGTTITRPSLDVLEIHLGSDNQDLGEWLLRKDSNLSLGRLRTLKLRDATGPRTHELSSLLAGVQGTLEHLEYEQSAKGNVNSFHTPENQWDEFPPEISALNLRSLYVFGYVCVANPEDGEKMVRFVRTLAKRSVTRVRLDVRVVRASYQQACRWLGVDRVLDAKDMARRIPMHDWRIGLDVGLEQDAEKGFWVRLDSVQRPNVIEVQLRMRMC